MQLIYNFCNPEEFRKVKRWDLKKKKFICINCPSAVMICNKSMGFRFTEPKLKKRWYLKVLVRCVEIAVV